MRKVLVFQHVANEILGTLNTQLKNKGFRIRYVFGESTNTAFYASSIGSLEHFLRDRGSDGIIARCDEVIEPTLRKKAKQLGHFCCWDFRNK